MLCNCADEEWESNKQCNLPDMKFTNVEVLLMNGAVRTLEEVSKKPFYFCNQDNTDFPPFPSDQGSNKWMENGQERLSRIYGWTCVAFLSFYCVTILGERIVCGLFSVFKGTYKVCFHSS